MSGRAGIGDAPIVIVQGQRGSGKSALLAELVQDNLWGDTETVRTYVVYDPFGQFAARWPKANRIENGTFVRGWVNLVGSDLGLEYAAKIAFDKGELVFVADEIDMVVNNAYGVMKPDSTFYRLIHYGRHYGVAIFAAFRRFANVNTDLRSEATALFTFRPGMEAEDRDRLKRFIGDENLALTLRLKRLQYARFDLATGQTRLGLVTFNKAPGLA